MMLVTPTPGPMPVHMAHGVTEMGDVTALCFKRPRAIDLGRARWTLRRNAVTCPRCLLAMDGQETEAASPQEAR